MSKSDTISRKQAIEAMGKAQWARDRLAELPDVEITLADVEAYLKPRNCSWIANEYYADLIRAADAPLYQKETVVTFRMMRSVCEHFSVSYDFYKDKHEDACHHKANIPKGDSWGVCSCETCPVLRGKKG